MTPEQKEAAIKEALKKRAGGAQKSTAKDGSVLLTAKIEKAERKQKAKKGTKTDDRDR